MNEIAAIPTIYSGVHFRSRLEAKWAALFDLLGWRWEYEPIDLHGYIPDFIVKTPDSRADRLIEVKPALKFTDYEPAQAKIKASGWRGPAACVGAIVGRYCTGEACLGSEWHGGEIWVPWVWEDAGVIDLWREAGNRVQWRKGQQRAKPRGENSPTYTELRDFFRSLQAEWEND